MGDEVRVSGGLVEGLHIVGDEVCDGEGLVVDHHTVGDDVHRGGGLVVDLHTVGDEVHHGGGLVVDLHTVGDDVHGGWGLEQVVLEDCCQRLGDSNGSYTDKLCLARWFGSYSPAPVFGGSTGWNELTLCWFGLVWFGLDYRLRESPPLEHV